MKDVLRSLHRNERVEILYHGKPCGLLVSWHKEKKANRVKKHLFLVCIHLHLLQLAAKEIKVLKCGTGKFDFNLMIYSA